MRALRLTPFLLAAAACGPSFPPRSVVFDTRVLAIVAEPLEAGMAQPVTLTAFRAGPLGGRIESERWSFCPFSIGSSAGYACAVPECELGIPLPQPALREAYGPSSPLTATPGELARQCLALLSGSGAIPPDVPTDPASFPDTVEVLFRYTATATGGPEREAVQRIPLWTKSDPPAANRAPVISSVSIGGLAMLPHGGTDPRLEAVPLDVQVQLTPESAEKYVEGDRELVEQLVVSFYSTAGRFDYDRANGPAASVQLKPEEIAPGTTAAQVWAVARDLRGGQAVVGPFQLTVGSQSPTPFP